MFDAYVLTENKRKKFAICTKHFVGLSRDLIFFYKIKTLHFLCHRTVFYFDRFYHYKCTNVFRNLQEFFLIDSED